MGCSLLLFAADGPLRRALQHNTPGLVLGSALIVLCAFLVLGTLLMMDAVARDCRGMHGSSVKSYPVRRAQCPTNDGLSAPMRGTRTEPLITWPTASCIE